MNTTKMLFSILISFRNRDTLRVKRCLDALKHQTFTSFEVLFCDYGSEEDIAAETKSLVQSYPFCKYIYNETRGLHWNQNHALNTCLVNASGKYVIRLDVDIILTPIFLASVSKIVTPQSYLHSHAYMLPENFTMYEKLFTNKEIYRDFIISNKVAVGLLMIIERDFFLSINGFDEFYTGWGYDDLEASKRIMSTYKQLVWLSLEELPVFHQWHPTVSSKNPTGWYDIKGEYYKQTTNERISSRTIGRIFTKEDRPALKLLQNADYLTLNEFKITYPKANSFTKICQKITLSDKEDYIYINYNNPFFSPTGKLSKYINKINNYFEKTSFSYRLTDIQKNMSGVILNIEVRDFLFYCIVNLKDHIQDYYFQYDDEKTICIIVMNKK